MLPTGFLYAGQKTFTGQLPEMNTTNIKFAHVTIFSAANKTAPDNPAGKLGFFPGSCFC